MRAVLLLILRLLRGITDDDSHGQYQPADQYSNYNPHQDPFGGYSHPPPIVIPHSTAILLGFSLVFMMLNRFGNQLERCNIAAHPAQLRMIFISIFQQITGLSGKAGLIRLANKIPGLADLYTSWTYNDHWYASQLPGDPPLFASLDDSHSYVKGLFSDVSQPSPWPNEIPPLSPLSENLPPVLTVAPQVSTLDTRVKVTFQKAMVVAILETGSPVKVISSSPALKIKRNSELEHAVVYGTVSTASTKSIGAYLALPLYSSKLVLTAPAVALKN